MRSLYHLSPVKPAPAKLPPAKLSLAKAALLCGAALALPLAAGCLGASGSSHSGEHGEGGAPEAKPATIEQLAEKTGCALASKRKSTELQQGNCQTAKGRYVLVSFS